MGDLVVDMDPFWAKFKAVKPWLEEDDRPPGQGVACPSRRSSSRIMKEALCILCGGCFSECNSLAADPEFMGPAALAKGQRFAGDVRDGDRKERRRR